MHLIDTSGATVDKKFTDGDAALAILATLVDARYMNAVQAELTTPVTALGFALNVLPDADPGNQLWLAMLELHRRGGRVNPVDQAVVNNQSSAADVTGFPTWLSTQVLSIIFFYRVYRRTDTGWLVESGHASLDWVPETSTWLVSRRFGGDGAGVEFNVAATGTANEFKLQYTSENQAGASYSGNLKITAIQVIRV